MAQSLPESIDLNAAVRNRWQFSGQIKLADLQRMPHELLHSEDSLIDYDIQFYASQAVLGEALIKVKGQLELICQRSLEPFTYDIEKQSTVGFISEVEDEDKLPPDVLATWVEDMLVDPQALIEDEILLLIPDYPNKAGAELDSKYLSDGSEEAESEDDNPFSVLKDLK
ncbi:YceD family protein [Marinicella gelatinilytica]|uniref:YceD family protein n=1 Tax=Marinicella gelatinilytica TaxID=2996017 RepID=UPI002260ACEF|nr:YceD family protein [Marinicella gelatinilytica]MCX7544644.1 YceD family protein [Marinicella gelatinilytica]